MAATPARSRPLTGDRLLGLPHLAQLVISRVQQIGQIGMAASHSPNDNQAAPTADRRVVVNSTMHR
jgi:hypothetical protein